MSLEGERWVGKQEQTVRRAQENSMRIDEVADGYASAVEKTYTEPSAPAIRNEVKKFVETVTSTDGPEQLIELQKLLKALAPYKSIFTDIVDDPYERAAFALALVRREKSLQ